MIDAVIADVHSFVSLVGSIVDEADASGKPSAEDEQEQLSVADLRALAMHVDVVLDSLQSELARYVY